MRKKFVFNLILLVFLNLLIKPFWVFGIDRTLQNTVGPASYGMYFTLYNFSVLFYFLLDFGITNFNNRAISHDKSLLKSYLPNILVARFILGAIYAGITIAIAFIIGYNAHRVALLGFLILNQFLLSSILYLRSNISGLQLYITDSLMSVLDRTVMIFVCGVVLLPSIFGIATTVENFIYAQTISYILAATVSLVVVLVKTGRITFTAQPQLIIDIIKGSLPFALFIFLVSIYSRIDSILIERLLPNGEHEAGIYAQSYRVLDALNMFAYLFPTLLLPMFSKILSSNGNIKPLVRLSVSIITVLSVSAAVVGAVHASFLVKLLYHTVEDNSIKAFSILMLSFVPMSIGIIFSTLLTAKGDLRYLNYTAIITLVANILLNLVLIPRLYSFGASIACLVTQLLAAMVQFYICYRLFNLSIKNHVVRFFAFVVASALLGWLIPIVVANSFFAIIVTFVSILLVAFMSGVIKLKEVFSLIDR